MSRTLRRSPRKRGRSPLGREEFRRRVVPDGQHLSWSVPTSFAQPIKRARRSSDNQRIRLGLDPAPRELGLGWLYW